MNGEAVDQVGSLGPGGTATSDWDAATRAKGQQPAQVPVPAPNHLNLCLLLSLPVLIQGVELSWGILGSFWVGDPLHPLLPA